MDCMVDVCWVVVVGLVLVMLFMGTRLTVYGPETMTENEPVTRSENVVKTKM